MTGRFIYFAGVLVALCISGDARAEGLVIDNFSCADSLSTTGPVFTNNYIACLGSVGGVREDVLFFTGGTGSVASSLASNPPAGAISGTVGANLDGNAIMLWTGSTTGGVANLPNLDLAADYILIQSESDLGGTLSVTIGSGPSTSNYLTFSAAMPANGFDSGFTDVLIPLVDPTMTAGTGANLSDVTAIGLIVSVPGGGSFELEGVSAEAPEPGTMALALAAGMLALFGKLKRR
jgi:hypothetical protein